MLYIQTQILGEGLSAKTTRFCLIGIAALLTVLCNPVFSEPVLASSRELGQTPSSLKRESLQNVEQLIRQAETAQLNDKYAEAEQIWRKIVQRQPDAIWAHYRLGKILYLQGKNEQEIAVYRQIIQQAPEEAKAHEEFGKALLTQSWGQSASLAERLLRQALLAYRRAVELQPDLVETLAWWANLPPERIVLMVRQDLQARPKRTAIDYLLLWSTIRNSRKVLEAKGFARQNLSAFCQKYPETCRDQGKSHPKQEFEALQQAIQLAPTLAISYEMLGLSQSELREYSQAAESFKQAIALNSHRAKTYYRLGETLIAQDRLDEAIRVLHQAVQVEPDTPWLDSMFWWAFSQQPVDQLIVAIVDQLKKHPNARSYYILGNLFASRQFTTQAHPRYLAAAASAFQNSVKLDPNFAKAHERLGYVLTAQKQLREAERAFREAIRINPQLKIAYTNLRNVLRTQGKFDDAFQVFLAEQSATQ